MGCDIHAYVEVREGGGWAHVDWRAKYRDGEYDDGSARHDWRAMFKDPLYIDRNYNLFAVLADVRNGRGFAGVRTGEGFVPIDMPRGLPKDATTPVVIESHHWDLDGHSHSWFLLKELLDYDYDQVTRQYGAVTLDEYRDFKEHGKPKSWSGFISGGRVEHIDNARADVLIESGASSNMMDGKDVLYVTHVHWDESYRDAIGPQWFETLEALKELGSPEDVRLVFWFDN